MTFNDLGKENLSFSCLQERWKCMGDEKSRGENACVAKTKFKITLVFFFFFFLYPPLERSHFFDLHLQKKRNLFEIEGVCMLLVISSVSLNILMLGGFTV